ncbi:MAG: hypothetical protein AAGE01_17040, partial [Pseudomonadota bacterium]
FTEHHPTGNAQHADNGASQRDGNAVAAPGRARRADREPGIVDPAGAESAGPESSRERIVSARYRAPVPEPSCYGPAVDDDPADADFAAVGSSAAILATDRYSAALDLPSGRFRAALGASELHQSPAGGTCALGTSTAGQLDTTAQLGPREKRLATQLRPAA